MMEQSSKDILAIPLQSARKKDLGRAKWVLGVDGREKPKSIGRDLLRCAPNLGTEMARRAWGWQIRRGPTKKMPTRQMGRDAARPYLSLIDRDSSVESRL
jgi:hypothetical protein